MSVLVVYIRHVLWRALTDDVCVLPPQPSRSQPTTPIMIRIVGLLFMALALAATQAEVTIPVGAENNEEGDAPVAVDYARLVTCVQLMEDARD